MLELDLRRLALAGRTLVADLHIRVPAGTVHTVMGPSGSGKSSVLAAICGTLAPAFAFEGSIRLGDQELTTLPTARRRVGILFQDDLLFAHMTVAENLLFAVPPGSGRDRRAQVAAALADLELSGYGDADPSTLSGGQRARVALMRALLAQPQALLLDEPFAKLDAALRERMRRYVFGRIQARGVPTLLVTHDPSDVADPQRVSHLPSP